MTDLSPAAQAVLDAWAASENGVYLIDDPERLAAALRAAVEQCASKREIHPDSLLTESIIEADDILAIAAELESHQ